VNGEFTSIRQDVISKIAEIVEASRTRFAAPTQSAYLSRDKGIDAEKATATVRRGVEPRGQRRVQIPR
jgi:MscS family membrane protein